MYLLDTNVISETRRPRPDRGVLNWLTGLPDEELSNNESRALQLDDVQGIRYVEP